MQVLRLAMTDGSFVFGRNDQVISVPCCHDVEPILVFSMSERT